MTGRLPPQSLPEDDLENTAELPALDAHALDSVPAWLRARNTAVGSSSDLTRLEEQRAALENRAAELARQLEERQQSEQQLRDALDQAEARIQELLAMAARHSAALAEADAELARLRGAASDEAAILKESLRQRDILEAELAAVRKDLHETAGGSEGQDPAVQVLQAQLAAKEQALQSLQESASTNAVWQRELQSELRAAEDQLRRKDAEIEEAHTQLAQARESEAQQRAAARQALAGERTAHALAAEREALLQSIVEELQSLSDEAQSPRELSFTPPLPERPPMGRLQLVPAVTRLLVRTDSDTEIAHVLGERTSIGRSSDNDLQLDVSSISRHHALIIAQAAQTMIEDLHSTNGVRVNGRRVKRQALRDGDTVVIGKAQFRFVLRAVVEAE